ncbi:FadR/GntR family transcriptional regulator [soil metagenome]
MGVGRVRTGGGNLHYKVAQDIGARILKGEFAPGALLPNEAEWGRAYKVSRTAVREAIKTLAGKGMIQSRPKIGSRVEPRASWNLLDRDVLAWYGATVAYGRFAQEVQQIRFMVEPEAAALSSINRTAAQLAEIEKAYEDMAAAVTERAWNVADVQFHLAILNASGNELIIPFGRAIEIMLVKLFVHTAADADHWSDALPFHKAIVTAIRDQKPLSARRAVRRLLTRTQNTIEKAAKRRAAV